MKWNDEMKGKESRSAGALEIEDLQCNLNSMSEMIMRCFFLGTIFRSVVLGGEVLLLNHKAALGAFVLHR
jgi:hypothetical protein